MAGGTQGERTERLEFAASDPGDGVRSAPPGSRLEKPPASRCLAGIDTWPVWPPASSFITSSAYLTLPDTCQGPLAGVLLTLSLPLTPRGQAAAPAAQPLLMFPLALLV